MKHIGQVIIEVHKGVAEVMRKPKGVTVLIRDYDCQEDSEEQDEDGKSYHQGYYPSEVEV